MKYVFDEAAFRGLVVNSRLRRVVEVLAQLGQTTALPITARDPGNGRTMVRSLSMQTPWTKPQAVEHIQKTLGLSEEEAGTLVTQALMLNCIVKVEK